MTEISNVLRSEPAVRVPEILITPFPEILITSLPEILAA